ncbi:MAG TPA: RNA polymerase sigma-70 factor [Steroidobacteraceae bacterium]
MEADAAIFQQHRPRLFGLAYRMLGTRADAEDMLQDAYLRWHRSHTATVRNPGAWLATTVTRLCIDRLRVARIEREAYRGPWLPEPIVDEPAAAPEKSSELASDLSMALLVVLERLSPEERAALLLREVFDSDYAEIAGVLGKNEAACRQMVHRALLRVRKEHRRFHVTVEAREELLDKFVTAIQAGDKQALVALFAEDATWTSDGGGKARASTKTLVGGARIAKLVLGFVRRFGHGLEFKKAVLNGEMGLLLCLGGRPIAALSIYTNGSNILAAYNVVNPEKLRLPVPRQ